MYYLQPCRNPLKSGQCFLPINWLRRRWCHENVAIPSNRVNVSYEEAPATPPYKSYVSKVAIPSNRVNVSYFLHKERIRHKKFWPSSQSPQIGSMFLTLFWRKEVIKKWSFGGRNPLKSGQCFLPQSQLYSDMVEKEKGTSQSPQIGSMFLTLKYYCLKGEAMRKTSRNPLKSGQCFLRFNVVMESKKIFCY